jgi:hypothetical protein
MPKTPLPQLRFEGITPVAPRNLGGLIRDQFANGRLSAVVGHHGGLLDISYWGDQNQSSSFFFRGALDTAWAKLFRFHVNVGEKRFYPILRESRLYPFGLGSHDKIGGVEIDHDLLLLPDAVVQRIHVTRNPKRAPIRIGMLHQEAITALGGDKRTWSDLVFYPKLNAFIASCTDLNPTIPIKQGEESLAQKDLGTIVDAPKATTWVGVGCSLPFKTHRGYHHRSKHYLLSSVLKGSDAAFFVAFARSRPALEKRLKALAKTVFKECARVVSDYEARLLARPRIDVGHPVLNSAFGQYPEMINVMKVPDQPGAVRAGILGGWIWGWDGMMPFIPTALSNESAFTASMLRFFHETRDARFGLPHQFTTGFKTKLLGPFPAQCQFIGGLYHYLAVTGDLSLAREVFPTCKFILDRCRERLVKKTGLVSGAALWPDYPEAMEEDGHDVSSMNNSLLYQGLRAMEYIAAKLGHAKLAVEYREWAKTLRLSFAKYLYNEKKGYFISSCSSIDLKPRKHYCCQAVFWITPFARELVSHAPVRIADFMKRYLRSARCLLSLPEWDTAWMADGNQLGSSYPAADNFYLHAHKIVGDESALEAWLGDVEWFWRHHTAPEAFTPEAENEEACGPDNTGTKQCQAVSTWYSGLYIGLAGLDFDHEGLTLTPWGHRPVDIRGLRLHGTSIDLKIRGKGNHIGSLKLNGKTLPAGSRKIAWKALKGKTARIELIRSDKTSNQPVIVRADGLRFAILESKPRLLSARIGGDMGGEVVIQTTASAQILINGKPEKYPYNAATKTVTVPFSHKGDLKLKIVS